MVSGVMTEINMPIHVDFVKEQILNHFAQNKLDVGHLLNGKQFYLQRMNNWNPKQQDALDEGLKSLENEGLIELDENNNAKLTAKGVDHIYPPVGSFVRDSILTSFKKSNSRAGHILNEKAFYFNNMSSWNPKQIAALDTAINELVSEGLVEIRDDKIFLSPKGEDYIYS